MLNVLFATKKNMAQAWTTQGKRLAITKLQVSPNLVIGEKTASIRTDASRASSETTCRILEIGYGPKKLANLSKSLRTRLQKISAPTGVRQITGVRDFGDAQDVAVGATFTASEVFQAGDLLKIQGITKGRGFAGGMKRHGFHGGPKTHGQSDRARAGGSVGQHTEPGRVFPGKRMPGHYGAATQTVVGLQVLFASTDELWVSGPIPGSFNSFVRLEKIGTAKKALVLDQVASALPVTPADVVADTSVVAPPEKEND
jgi:large subunit ribosomal protein L3